MLKTISLLCSLSVCTISYLLATSSTAIAQVTSDGTVNTQVTTDGNSAEITGGETRGDNLFHSFQDFSVPTNNEAFFNNANDIANIFSRVTGGNISNIDGLIRANGSANLFLVNPAGILFGENASLDIGGSFYGSTADSILFEDGEYSATDLDSPPLLTINAPIGLNLRDNPGEIINRSVVQNNAEETGGLKVSPGNNLTLVGGDINLEGGNLTATGGRIELGGLSQAGTVTFNGPKGYRSAYDGSLGFPTDVSRADVTLSNTAVINVTGTGGGDIAIDARNLTLEAGELGESRIGAGISEDSTNSGAQAGDITIDAINNVTVENSVIANQVEFSASGSGGDVTITTDTMSLTNGGVVSAATFGQGNGGNVEIAATGTIAIDGANSQGDTPSGAFSNVDSEDVGDAGNVTVTTESLSLTNGGQVNASTFGRGNAGSVEITADRISIDGENSQGTIPSGAFSIVDSEAVGDAESITITTDTLSITNGGQVNASTFGRGNAGSVEITAADRISIDGENSQGDIPSGAFSIVGLEAVGNAGGVTIVTDTLSLTSGGQVNTSTFGRGNAGDASINARDLIAISGATNSNRSGLTASALFNSGDGGNVNVLTDILTIDDGIIAASNFDRLVRFEPGTGEPGDINIEANDLSLSNNASIDAATQSETGNSANINLQIADNLTLENSSSISAQAFEEADGGQLSIDAEFIVAFPDGNNDIFASAAQGQGGDINITAESLLGIQERPLNPFTNDINASSEVSGLDGTVDISTLDVDPVQGATELPTNIVVPEETTQQACQSNREAEAQNGLNIVGKGGVPPAPELPLNSLNTVSNGEMNPVSTIPAPIETSRGKIQPARGIEVTPSGVVRLTAYATNNAGDRLPQIESNCDRFQ